MGHKVFYQRNLPHWQPEGGIFFVTTRVFGSIPRDELLKLKEEQVFRQRKMQGEGKLDGIGADDLLDESQWYRRWDDVLDVAGSEPFWLGRADIAEVVSEALRYRDERMYELLAFCIMPNHLHMVIKPFVDERSGVIPLFRIMQSLKRHTARKANEILGREGAFWHAEFYDHVVRDEASLERILVYVVENPVKAGLVRRWRDWRWTYLRDEYMERMGLG